MTPQNKRIAITLETLLESVDLAESIVIRVSDAAGFSEDECHKIGMSIREGVINAYNYGNSQDRRKKIFFSVEFEADKMIVRIVDQGRGFDVTKVPDPLAEENLLRTSGRGIFLMRAFMDEFSVQHAPDGGAEIIMAKRLPDSSDNGASSEAHKKGQ
jgi:serine/threonine-protein kinase RsbW